jgi:hypothetical protein
MNKDKPDSHSSQFLNLISVRIYPEGHLNVVTQTN